MKKSITEFFRKAFWKTRWYFLEYAFKIYKLFIYGLAFITSPLFILIRKIKRKKILYFSLVDWKWIKQRPHFVPLFLAKHGYKVDYYFEQPYKKYIIKNDNNIINLYNDKKLKIKKWKFYPYDILKSEYNRFVFVTRSFFLNYDKIIFTNPKQVSNIFMTLMKLRKTKIYYECMDDYLYWEPDYNINFFHGKEKYLTSISESIIVSSNSLKNMLCDKYQINSNKIVVIRNGYDRESFTNVCDSTLKLKHPNAVYIGTIDEWFDINSIINYAEQNPKITIYLIGPISTNMKKIIENIKCKNIVFTGAIEHQFVAGTIVNSDILLLPFIKNSLIEKVDPVKLYEYLFFEKIVVSLYWDELEQFKDFVVFYKKSSDFSKAMKKALNFKIDDTSKLKKLIKESSWDERLKKYLQILER